MSALLHRNNRRNRIPQNPREAASRAVESCEAWNRLYPVGTRVRVYRLRGDESGAIDTVTTSQAWVMAGHSAMISVRGLTGGYCLTHVRPLIGQSENKIAELRRELGEFCHLSGAVAAVLADHLAESGVVA